MLSYLRSLFSANSYTPLPEGDEPKLGWSERFFRRNYRWALYLKTLPSMLLLGTFGRRPITIAKLATPKVVESFAAFLGPLLGPILFLALIDSLYIAATVFQENWRIKQYEKAKQQRQIRPHEQAERPEDWIGKIRALIEQLPPNADKFNFIKTHSLDTPFRDQLYSQSIDEKLFIEHLLKTNRFTHAPRELAKEYINLTNQKNLNYAALWLNAQVDYLRLRLQENKKHMPAGDLDMRRVFILNNILTSRMRHQLGKMDIDENKFVEYLIDPAMSPDAIVQYFKPGKKSLSEFLFGKKNSKEETFNFGEEWFTTEIKIIQCQSFKPMASARLLQALEDTFLPESQIIDAAYHQQPSTTRYEYSHQNIVNRFKCLTTEKDFGKEYPIIDKFIYYYEYYKKILVFPLRTISLCLALEIMMPFSFPLLTSIAIYASIGLALSFMIVKLEGMTDNYLKELKAGRDKELEGLHESERVGTFSRLYKNSENKKLKDEIDHLHHAPMTRTRSEPDLTHSSNIIVLSDRINGSHLSPSVSPAVTGPSVLNERASLRRDSN